MKFSRIWDSGIRKVLYFFNTLPVMSDINGPPLWIWKSRSQENRPNKWLHLAGHLVPPPGRSGAPVAAVDFSSDPC